GASSFRLLLFFSLHLFFSARASPVPPPIRLRLFAVDRARLCVPRSACSRARSRPERPHWLALLEVWARARRLRLPTPRLLPTYLSILERSARLSFSKG